MHAMARACENAAHWLEIEADFLNDQHLYTEAAMLRKHANVLRARAAKCDRHAQTLFNAHPSRDNSKQNRFASITQRLRYRGVSTSKQHPT